MESKDNWKTDISPSPGSGEQAGQDLRRQAEEELSRKKGALSPDHPEALSPEETRRMLHELQVYQIELKLQNEELQKSHAEMDAIRERYFDLYDLAPVGYCTVSEKKLILEANLTLAILLDVSRSALIQSPMSQFILNQDQDIYYLLLKNLFNTDEPQACELRMMRRDGTSFWARMEATTTRDADGAPLGRIALSDISEQQAGEALRQSEEKYHNIYYHSVLGIFRSTFEGRFIDMNPALARLLGYDSPQEAIDLITNIAEQVYAKPHERDAAAKAILEAGEHISTITHYRRRDGAPWYGMLHLRIASDQQGRPSHYEGFVEDITHHKQTEDALRAAHQRMENIIEGTHVGTWEWNVQTGETLFNEVWAQIIGYTLDELAPTCIKTWEMFVCPDDMKQSAELLERHFAGELPYYDCEYRMKHKNGQWVWIHDRGCVITRTGDGKPLMMFGTHTDITERKRTEEVQAFLAQTNADTHDEPFFEVLARFLAENLRMNFVCIDRLEGDGLTARTLAVWHDGHFEDNVTYALKDTPCGEVVGKSVCCFPASVCRLFPRDQVLQDMRAESYAGVTLFNHAGLPIGLIAVIGRSPLENRPLSEKLLKMVAVRAAAELERQDVEAALRSSLAEKDMLLKEVHHRVKNNLAAVMGLLYLLEQALENQPARIALAELSARIKSMAMIHEQLYQSEAFSRIDFQVYLEELCAYLRSSYHTSGDISVSVSAVGVVMGLDIAVPCGLLITELVTNAFKYAFPAGRQPEAGCKINVSAQWDGVAYTLAVVDNGVGLPAGLNWSNTKTMGLVLVKMLGQHQLQGRIEVDCTEGTTFRLKFANRNKHKTSGE
jgi:PAS domain S-box-containing protein